MSFDDIRKDIFVRYLQTIKPAFYKFILDGNKTILDGFNIVTPDDKIPLWMISGGEAINYYTAEAKKTPTKDIDAKLLFTGAYTIPSTFFKGTQEGGTLPDAILHVRKTIKENFDAILTPGGFDFSIVNNDVKKGVEKGVKKSVKNVVNNPFTAYILDLFDKQFIKYVNQKRKPLIKDSTRLGFKTRGDILWACISAWFTVDKGQGNTAFIKPDGTFGDSININGITAHSNNTNDWINFRLDLGSGLVEQSLKMYVLKVPYLFTGHDEESFPYSGGFEKGMREITDDELNSIHSRIQYLVDNSAKGSQIWDIYYKTISLMNLRRNLFSLIGVVILVARDGRKYIIQEGVLDLYMDFHAGEVSGGKVVYENKLASGMIPSIIKPVEYCDSKSFIKIPTLNWLLHDQTRMLYHSLRLQEVGRSGWTDKGVSSWTPYPDGNQKKYFSKLLGMISTYYDTIKNLEGYYSANKDACVNDLQQCTDETMCTPQVFTSYLYSIMTPTNFVPIEYQRCLTGLGRGVQRKHSKKKITRRIRKPRDTRKNK
jgi:hypothetical protein